MTSAFAAPDAGTVTGCDFSPKSSCHVLRRYVPGGTGGNANRPSLSVTAAYGVSATKSHAVIHVWTSHFNAHDARLGERLGEGLPLDRDRPVEDLRGAGRRRVDVVEHGVGVSDDDGRALRHDLHVRREQAVLLVEVERPLRKGAALRALEPHDGVRDALVLREDERRRGRSALPQIATSAFTGRGASFGTGPERVTLPKTPCEGSGERAVDGSAVSR